VGEGDCFGDVVHVGCESDQAVDAERDAGTRRQRGESREEFLVERWRYTACAAPGIEFALESSALLGGIGEFAKPVGEFDSA
jgi:hypothetical protein